ncbi:MAG: universal stress protein [Nitrospiraceae bacterium]|nr:universal stress protein [Nitrospiraceae bacterium]
MDFKKILYPTDFTDGSAAARRMAAELARKYGSTLYIVHVLYDISRATGWYVPHVNLEELYKDMEKTANMHIRREMLEDLRDYGNIEYAVLHGVPAEEILRFAQEKGIDLIVMGTHGRKGLDKVLFGSTAEKVVRGSRCPVLTVRAPEA